MKKLIISISVFSLLLFSCTNNVEKAENKVETETEEMHQHETTKIELNKGEKWAVDSNMIVFIREMENDIKTFTNADKKDYKALATILKENIDKLTSNCTMKGKAHDELHKWLLPFIDMVTELSEAKDVAESKDMYIQIQKSFVTFNTYFQ
jgi:hypothetical protein